MRHMLTPQKQKMRRTGFLAFNFALTSSTGPAKLKKLKLSSVRSSKYIHRFCFGLKTWLWLRSKHLKGPQLLFIFFYHHRIHRYSIGLFRLVWVTAVLIEFWPHAKHLSHLSSSFRPADLDRSKGRTNRQQSHAILICLTKTPMDNRGSLKDMFLLSSRMFQSWTCCPSVLLRGMISPWGPTGVASILI